MDMKQIKFYGTGWCPDCVRSKQFLDDHQIPYEYIDLSVNEEAAEEVMRLNNGMQSIPTIVCPDGNVLVEPTNDMLEYCIKKFN
jgi:glutaredoxin